jgi:putative ABC transport system substrate-binding protein
MRRREFVTLLGGAAATWPLAAHAQQPATPVIGFLTSRAPGADAHLTAEFRQGLAATGYFEGRNVTIEYRFAENQYDRLPALAADLVRRQVAVIFANGVSAAVAKAATATIPIIFTTGGDPIKSGLVDRLHRPGSNATGATTINIGMGPARLDLLRDLVPDAGRIGFLFNPDSPLTNLPEMQEAAEAAGRQLFALGASSERELGTAFADLVRQKLDGLIIGADPLFVSRREQLVVLAARSAVPAIYFGREFAEAGGLMSYGARLADAYRQAGVYTGRVLRGEKPADLPVQQSTKFELIINVNAPPPKGGGFELRLKAGLVRLRRTQVTLKSSSGSGGVWFLMYSAQTSSDNDISSPKPDGTCSPKQYGCLYASSRSVYTG